MREDPPHHRKKIKEHLAVGEVCPAVVQQTNDYGIKLHGNPINWNLQIIGFFPLYFCLMTKKKKNNAKKITNKSSFLAEFLSIILDKYILCPIS